MSLNWGVANWGQTYIMHSVGSAACGGKCSLYILLKTKKVKIDLIVVTECYFGNELRWKTKDVGRVARKKL